MACSSDSANPYERNILSFIARLIISFYRYISSIETALYYLTNTTYATNINTKKIVSVIVPHNICIYDNIERITAITNCSIISRFIITLLHIILNKNVIFIT